MKKDEGSVRHCPRSLRVLEEHDCTSSMWKSSWHEPPPPAQLVTWEGPAITGVASRYNFLRCKGLSPTPSATSSPTALPFAFPEPQPSPYCGTVLKAPGHRSQPGPHLPSFRSQPLPPKSWVHADVHGGRPKCAAVVPPPSMLLPSVRQVLPPLTTEGIKMA